MYSDIPSDILSGKYSGILSSSQASYLAFFQAFYLASILTFFLAFYSDILSGILFWHSFFLTFHSDILTMASILTLLLTFYLAWVRAHPPSTACCAHGMEFGSRIPPQHPALGIWMSGPHTLHCILSSRYGVPVPAWPTRRRWRGEGRGVCGKKKKKKRRRSCTFVEI